MHRNVPTAAKPSDIIILDTDALSTIQRAGGKDYQALIARLAESPQGQVYVTIVSFEEQTRGWLSWMAKAKTAEQVVRAYAKLRELLEDFRNRPIIDYTDDSASKFGELTRARVRMGTMDLRIASIALVHGATLLSRNLKHFRKVPGLIVEDWTIGK